MEVEVENLDPEKDEDVTQWCNKCIKLLYLAESEKVIMYEDEEELENHDEEKLDMDNIKILIAQLFNNGVTKPSSVLHQLRNQNPPLAKYPSKQQLYYEISKLKREKFGVVTISIKELNDWILKNSALPENDDEPFVVKHETGTNLLFGGIHCTLNNDDENDDDDVEDFGIYFRFFVTTKRLLSIAIEKDHVTTDATFKLLQLGFPVLIVGTTCKNCNYHPFGIGLASNEKTKDFKLMFESVKEGLRNIFQYEYRPTILQADSARAITRGFEQAFDYHEDTGYIRLNCWSHVNRNCDHRLVCVKDKTVKENIKNDLKCLQLSHNQKTFDKLLLILFVK